ncbi:DedA family protein [Candidatus Saccharibacteria bacterium]|nr:DedA family protein [Candidatus Saccharibacteria bacterium]
MEMFSPSTILEAGGLIAVALVIFAETGLLFGIVFPGDSLLLAGGFLAAQGKLDINWLIALTMIAAIAGYQTGYDIGEKAGPRVFKRKDGLFFRKEYVERTSDFFSRHGGKTIILARFIPYVRTFVPVVAGVGHMSQKSFAIYNFIGGVLWAGGLTLLSYWLGSNIPNFDKYILITVLVSLTVFHATIFWHLLHNADRRRNFKRQLGEEWKYFFGRNQKS